ncbi:uncharacterized protein LOC113311598 [Papaver somniferum]|uniref:uncharacterized protein LOC113311598 n=1 Tax=Papaver somniferum TaxID=3469 RepID=UPI000E7056DE|nr:uncharacterized protein LOC113311598 [Papaver somniferum]
MRKRREKGLCYNCDEVFQAGHRCIKQQIFMLVVDEEDTIPSGEESPCDTPLSPGTKEEEHEFQWDMRLLKLGGCDMVLGVDWMKIMSPMSFDFQKLTVTFTTNGKTITLQGNTSSAQISMISGSDLHKWLKKNKHGLVGSLFSITACEHESEVPDPIKPLLHKYESIFQEPTSLPPSRTHDHHIPLKPLTTPPNQRPYRIPYLQKEVVEQLVQEMLKSGVIQHTHSPFSSPVILVKKKDGSWRFCVDYRRLNEATVKDKYPIPIIEELLDELFGSKVFSKIDLRAGYHQIRVYPPDTYKTAFKTHQGHYEFMVMPFGLTNAPASFQSLMNDVFGPHLRKFILVFFDDILVYSPDMDTHLKHLEVTLKTLQDHSLFSKLSKCTFGQNQVEYLGHIITGKGIAADPSKISCMVNWPTPTILKALRGFLGLTGYYRKFFKGYGVICRPLTDLLKKDNFKWNVEAQSAFEYLKKVVTTIPVLILPDFTQPFEVETDACDTGVGAALMQRRKPIAYFSKGMMSRFLSMYTYEKELLDVVMAVTKWSPYLMGNHFTIFTDHQSLKYFLEQKLHTIVQQKWLSELLGYDYTVCYKKGVENKLHGLPATIVSDRDSVFLSNFWQELFTKMGTTLHMSSAYHPQTDGQTKRVNACLESYLRCMTSYRPTKWITPFQALYGYNPQQFGLFSHNTSPNAVLEDYLQKRHAMGIILKSTLEEAQHRTKQQADKNRTEGEFQIGDWVYLRLQPYRQTSVQLRKNLKLYAKFFGPYQVLAKLGKVAYKIQLPPSSRIHPVFHVSQLNPKLGAGLLPQTTLTALDSKGCMKVTPLQVLSSRTVKKHQQIVDQVLIHWAHSSEADATWEDKEALLQQFPKFILEDKNVLK